MSLYYCMLLYYRKVYFKHIIIVIDKKQDLRFELYQMYILYNMYCTVSQMYDLLKIKIQNTRIRKKEMKCFKYLF